MSNRAHRRPAEADGAGDRPPMPLRGFENAGPPNFGLPTNSPFTVEGQIEREAALFAGARRVGGWRKWIVYAFFGIAAVMLIWTLVWGVVRAL